LPAITLNLTTFVYFATENQLPFASCKCMFT
jgi:hypothetical protein